MDAIAGRFSPKMAVWRLTPLPGSVTVEWRRCGKPSCRCASNRPQDAHGPYARWVWRENGRTRRQYVRLADVQEAVAACALHRELYPSQRALRRVLRDLSNACRPTVVSASVPAGAGQGSDDD